MSRRLATALPGPVSTGLLARKRAAVAAGVGTTVPVFAARAGGGLLEDVDGNLLIDLGSGIAVTSVGASHPRVVRAVQEQAARFTHTCFMVTPYEGYVAVAERLDQVLEHTRDLEMTRAQELDASGVEHPEDALRRIAKQRFDHRHPIRIHILLDETENIDRPLKASIEE